MKINKLILLIAIFSLSSLWGCSSSPSSPGDAEAAAKAGTIFSDNRELDYVSGTEDYRIGPSDLLEIKVFQAEELSRDVRVDPQGNITLPLLGKIPVAGQTQAGLEQKLAELMQKTMLQNPQVTVFIKEFTSQRVTVEGEVSKPGVYPISGQATVLQAIAMSEGLTNLASPDKVVLFRRSGQQTKAYHLDLEAIRDGKARDPFVRNDDRIVVHRSDSRFWMKEVTGTVRGLFSPFSF